MNSTDLVFQKVQNKTNDERCTEMVDCKSISMGEVHKIQKRE
jgi:hypothetical protein